MKVLVVDDSAMARMMIGKMIEIVESDGVDVTEAGDGAEAIEKMAGESFDLVVSDLNMPRVDGYEFLTDEQTQAQISTVPVVFITSGSNTENDARLLAAGAVAVLKKPLVPALLHETFEDLRDKGLLLSGKN